MGKSVYSLVLMDEVVEEIDKLAYIKGTNRSNVINSILARYLSLSTPQEKVERIYKTLESCLKGNEAYKVDTTVSNGSFLIKSAMRYKYNPIIKYYVELYKNTGGQYGCIKVHIRTQNAGLISLMNDFYKMFAEIEYEFIDFGERPEINFHTVENGKLIRQFIIKSQFGFDEKLVGEAISLYVDNLDKSIKAYVECIGNEKNPYETLKMLYRDYMKKQKLII